MAVLRQSISAHAQRGQGLVEFALIGPLFFLFVFAIMEGALLMNAQASLDNAAREGVRAAVVCGKQFDCEGTAIRPAVLDHLGILGTGASRLSVVVCLGVAGQPCPTTSAPNSCPQAAGIVYGSAGAGAPAGSSTVEVDVYYHYDFYLGAFVGAAGPSTCMTSKARTATS